MYDTGEAGVLSVPQDDVEAVRWYRLAAERGYAVAQLSLGVMYSDGRGVPQDDVEAQKWYNLAASHVEEWDHNEYEEIRDTLAKRVTPAQLAEAQRRASEWQAAFDARQE